MVKIFRLLLLINIVLLSNNFAQSLSISAFTDTTTYKVGDYIVYTIEARHNKDVHIYMPSVKDSIKSLEFIHEIPPVKTESGQRIIELFKFVFSKYDSGKVTIPPIQIAYTEYRNQQKKYLSTNPFTILVQTLPVNMQEEIRDVKEPLKLPLPWLFIILLVLIFMTLVLLGYFIYKKYKKKNVGEVFSKPEVVVPAYAIALNELHILEDKKLWQQGFVKDYHSNITEIIRKYFEDRFNFKALELTSSEIIDELKSIEGGYQIIETTNNFLSNADLVKFAKFQPMPKVNEEMMTQAYSIVNDTIPKQNVTEQTEKSGVENVQ